MNQMHRAAQAGEGAARSQPRKVGGGGGGKDEKGGRVFHVAIALPQYYALHVDPSIVSPPPLLANLPKVDVLLIF